jgi:hypothetical protein
MEMKDSGIVGNNIIDPSFQGIHELQVSRAQMYVGCSGGKHGYIRVVEEQVVYM